MAKLKILAESLQKKRISTEVELLALPVIEAVPKSRHNTFQKYKMETHYIHHS